MNLPPQFMAELRARTSLVEIAKERVKLRRSGREWIGCCPFHHEKSGSFTVNEDKAFVHCFGCGAHGDAITFIMRYESLGFMDAVRYLAARAGLAVPGDDGPPPEIAPRPVVKRTTPEDQDQLLQFRIQGARDKWAAGLPWRGTLVEDYLRGRGCCPPDDLAHLRFLPTLKYKHHREDGSLCRGTFAAQIAPFQSVDREIRAVHVTYLGPDGRKADVPRAKKMFGPAWGCAIRFAAPARILAVAEGIETGLSVRRACPDLAIWVAGSLGNVAGDGHEDGPVRPHPVSGKPLPTVYPDMERPGMRLPAGVEEVIILADADGDRPTGEVLVERAARRFTAQGLRVRVALPPAGMDFNDMIMEAA